jgi:hypothetical protein
MICCDDAMNRIGSLGEALTYPACLSMMQPAALGHRAYSYFVPSMDCFKSPQALKHIPNALFTDPPHPVLAQLLLLGAYRVLHFPTRFCHLRSSSLVYAYKSMPPCTARHLTRGGRTRIRCGILNGLCHPEYPASADSVSLRYAVEGLAPRRQPQQNNDNTHTFPHSAFRNLPR